MNRSTAEIDGRRQPERRATRVNTNSTWSSKELLKQKLDEWSAAASR